MKIYFEVYKEGAGLVQVELNGNPKLLREVEKLISVEEFTIR